MRKRMITKLVVLGVISSAMLIALSSISGLAQERESRAWEVRNDIAASYAGEQRIIGPVFTIHYQELWTQRTYNKDKDTWYDKQMVDTHVQYVYPESFRYAGAMTVQERYRGIFKANVFQSKGTVTGAVHFPDLDTLSKRKGSTLELVSANACMLMSDLRGFTRVPEFNWNGTALEMIQGSDLERFGSGIHAKLPDAGKVCGQRFDFEINLAVHGMGQLTFVPVGDENQIQISSNWPHPGFIGDFLASEREVTPEGFSAEWHVNGLASSAQQSISKSSCASIQQLGVSMVDPVNAYSMADRALKYGFLFIFITFAAFFLFEMLANLQIHPVQYGFVGIAQSVFFLLLLSLSEHIGFGGSYCAAATATVLLIILYLAAVLNGVRRGFIFGGLLSLLYGVLFALLQSEDHALVAGSALIFGLMALTMLMTRRIDWYAIDMKQEGAAS